MKLNTLTTLIATLLLLNSFHQTVTQGNTCDCGGVQRQRRIIGGVETSIDVFPWTVLIRHIVGSGADQLTTDLCGGTLIEENYVVTAAHCFGVYNPMADRLEVVLGQHDLTQTANSVVMQVFRLQIHERYNATSVENDIALLVLVHPVTLSANIQKACIPPEGLTLSPSSMVIVSGWGATIEGGPNSDVLRSVSVPVVSINECQNRYKRTPARIGTSNVCAGYTDGSREADACQSDSGGPLVYLCNNRYSYVGVVSFGIGCSNPQFPGVYANVAFYRNWLITNTFGARLCFSDCMPPPATVEECGWSNDRGLTKRIVGGSQTLRNQYPWMVSLYVRILSTATNTYTWTFSCGATLISKSWVLTAAKCVDKFAVSDVLLVLGDYDINNVNEEHEVVVTPSRFVTHPQYNNPFGSNDIALVQLRTPVSEFSDYIRPICIPNAATISSPAIYDTQLRVLGWGRIKTEGAYAGPLKQVMLPTMKNSVCKNFYGTFVTDTMICTVSSSSADVCEGDGGGPLMMADINGRHFQLAIQSLIYARNGVATCGTGRPAVNTLIGPYVTWIEQQIGAPVATVPANNLPPT